MQQEATGETDRKFLGASNGCLYRLTHQEDWGDCLCIGSLIGICGMTGSPNKLPGRAESLRILNQRLSNFSPLPLVSSWATRKQVTLIWASVYALYTHTLKIIREDNYLFCFSHLCSDRRCQCLPGLVKVVSSFCR